MPGEVVVMVDLSPSTRGANYRSRSLLDARIHELLGSQRYRVRAFASGAAEELPEGAMLGDLPADTTTFKPPAGAAAVVVFTDGRFDAPTTSIACYPVIDPGLQSPRDARMESLEIRGREALAGVVNSGEPRVVALGGVLQTTPVTVAPGSQYIARPVTDGAVRVSAQFSPGDLWPENDLLIANVPPSDAQQWWVGGSAPGAPWHWLSPAQLAGESAAYLAPSIIVLENVAARDLSDVQQQRLKQYVRDLGGTLLLLGGDHAFGAGGYTGTLLESMSPLASTPPAPMTQWILLTDGSGSMAAAERAVSRWQYATDAVVKVIDRLPPDDLLSVGSFAESLNWWSSGKSVRQTSALALPPSNAFPHGPTNLEPVLRNLAESQSGDLPAQLLLLTDADVRISDPGALATALKQKKIRMHLLAIGNGSGLPELQALVSGTGGTLLRQFDPTRWAASVQDLLRAASPDLLVRQPAMIRWTGNPQAVPLQVTVWNRTWLKSRATLIAQVIEESHSSDAGAQWDLGQGRVVALAFDPAASAIEPLIEANRRSPRDPRYPITWDAQAHLHVRVEAADGKRLLNDQKLQLILSRDTDGSGDSSISSLTQTGPGEYEITVDTPRVPTFAAVSVDGRVLERIAVAGRYPPEFDALGNDRAAMESLARRTGGQVIAPDRHVPIAFRFPVREVKLQSILAVIGALMIALALVRWNFG